MPTAHEHFVSMSTSRDQGAVLYVVSRSGKVLESEQRSRRIVNRDYFEGELEGWILWGSSRGSSSSNDGEYGHEEGFIGRSGRKGLFGKTFDSLTQQVSWQARIPFVVWGDETGSVPSFFSRMHWTQSRMLANMTTIRRQNIEGWEDANVVFGSGCLKTHDLFRSERWYRMEQCYKIGLAQITILQKSDIGSGWEPGARELAARWTAWLLKMLRKTGSRPLQHLLFTMLSAVLPGICSSLVREQWNRVPDQELCRSVDIVWAALKKSHASFTSAQWEILEERLDECRQMQKKLENFTGRYPRGGVPRQSLEGSLCMEELQNGMRNQSSQDSHQPCSIKSRDELLSNMLLKTEGVSALVTRALRDKLSTQQSTHGDWKELGFFGGSGRIVSLECPISRKRIKVPARGQDCSHLSCFDLQPFLEKHTKQARQMFNSAHQQKKPKVGTGSWCCPICGSGATWPQIVVDGVLSRILEVLPEDMPQVCLLPNGRWRMVWSPVGSGENEAELTTLAVHLPFNSTRKDDIYSVGQYGLDLGHNDTKLTAVAVHLPFKSTLEDGLYNFGQYGALQHDTCEAIGHCLDCQQSCACREVQTLQRAYKAWKEGVDHHLSKGSSAEQKKLRWGANSTLAVWTGDHNSNRDSFWQLSSQDRINDREQWRGIGEISESVNDMMVDSGIQVVDKVARISEAETTQSQKIKSDECEAEIPATAKVTVDAAQAPEEIAPICEWGKLRIGKHKSRPKQMAKRTLGAL